MKNFNNLENFNYKPEQNQDILVAASVLANKIIESKKDLINQLNFSDEIQETVKQLNKKVFFKIEDNFLWDLALKNILQRKSLGDYNLYQTKKFNNVAQVFLDNLKNEAMDEAFKLGADFYGVLSDKLTQAKRDGLELDNEYIEKNKDNWGNKYYSKL